MQLQIQVILHFIQDSRDIKELESESGEEDIIDWERSTKRNTKKRKGRKSQWSANLTNDLIDIILEDDRMKEKRLVTNVKNSKNSEFYEKVIKELKERC